jgi:hypothetical protein
MVSIRPKDHDEVIVYRFGKDKAERIRERLNDYYGWPGYMGFYNNLLPG